MSDSNTGHCDLYLYRTDIKHFFEEIPIHQASKLWPMLDNLLPSDTSAFIKALFRDAIRPVYQSLTGNLVQNRNGIPFGSPVSCIIANLYLSEVDAKFDNIQDLFYARYGDDILIAHKDPQTLLQMEYELRQKIGELGLRISKEKDLRLYFNRAGKPPTHPQFKGTSTLPYLGHIIHANGKLQASQRRTDRFMSLCKELIKQTAEDTSHLAFFERGMVVCDKLNKVLFNKEYPKCYYEDGQRNHYRKTKEILLRTNDVNYLKQLDLRIAQWIAEAITGLSGGRALRKNFYWTLRNVWHLSSLALMRNTLNHL